MEQEQCRKLQQRGAVLQEGRTAHSSEQGRGRHAPLSLSVGGRVSCYPTRLAGRLHRIRAVFLLLL